MNTNTRETIKKKRFFYCFIFIDSLIQMLMVCCLKKGTGVSQHMVRERGCNFSRVHSSGIKCCFNQSERMLSLCEQCTTIAHLNCSRFNPSNHSRQMCSFDKSRVTRKQKVTSLNVQSESISNAVHSHYKL